jgi:hypothetical protein
MDIYNIDTGKTHTLRMIDPQTGIDFVADWMGRIETSNLHWNEEEDRLEGDQQEIDWWIETQNDSQKMYDLIHELKEAHGSEAIQAVLDMIGNYEFGEQAKETLRVLRTKFSY